MKIAEDKKKHFWAGLLISIAAVSVMLCSFPKYYILPYALVGIFSTTAIGLLKEYVWDAWISRSISVKTVWKKVFKKDLPDGCVEFKDLLYTIYGGLAGAAVMVIILILL